MRILCLGISHKSASVDLREKLAMDAAAAREALCSLRQRWPQAQWVLLSTCNRTELYCARPVHGHPREEELRQFFAARATEHVDELDDSALYSLTDAAAVRHLLAVSAGLESMVLGEPQITSQVKIAYALAAESQTAGPVMAQLFQTALHVAKHVRSETPIAQGKVSVASAAVDFLSREFNTLDGKCVLSIGAGKMNRLMLQRIAQLGASRVLVANRSPQKAAELADACGGSVANFESLGEHLALADVVLTSTGARLPIITRPMVEQACRGRLGRQLLILDIAMPRDVAPQAGDIPGVRLFNIDDLQRVVDGNLRSRHAHLVPAEHIVAQHVAQVLDTLNIRQVAPTIHALYRRMNELAEAELAEAINKLATHADIEEDKAILQRALHRTIRRILDPAARNLRRSAGSDAARSEIAALRRLFELDMGGGDCKSQIANYGLVDDASGSAPQSN